MTEDWLKDARTRLLATPQPGCWLALIARAIEPRVETLDAGVAHTPAHYLVGAWAPGPLGLYPRLPEFAAIASPDSSRALRELFVHLPAQARVHLVDASHADAALLARMVLLCDSNLEPYQREALHRFIEASDDRLAATILQRYTDRERSYERFRDRLSGDAG